MQVVRKKIGVEMEPRDYTKRCATKRDPEYAEGSSMLTGYSMCAMDRVESADQFRGMLGAAVS